MEKLGAPPFNYVEKVKTLVSILATNYNGAVCPCLVAHAGTGRSPTQFLYLVWSLWRQGLENKPVVEQGLL
jgi:hypothetical protein